MYTQPFAVYMHSNYFCKCGTRLSSSVDRRNINAPRCGKCCRLERERRQEWWLNSTGELSGMANGLGVLQTKSKTITSWLGYEIGRWIHRTRRKKNELSWMYNIHGLFNSSGWICNPRLCSVSTSLGGRRMNFYVARTYRCVRCGKTYLAYPLNPRCPQCG